MKRAIARACSNIALAKYWGKADIELNLPAVPSLSLTLDALWTETAVEFDDSLRADQLVLNGKPADAQAALRVTRMLDRVRSMARHTLYAHVKSKNNFPTAAGLASSASGFAALAGAASAAAGLNLSLSQISALARHSSASAARSVYGGFVELAAGQPGDADLAAVQLAAPEHWDIAMVIAVVDDAAKSIGSTEAMQLSANTSPYYGAWLKYSSVCFAEIRQGVLERRLAQVGPAMEASTLAMHACTLTSQPAVFYWKPATLELLDLIRRLRQQEGLEAWFTMDAGAHVKAFCHTSDAARIATAIESHAAVQKVQIARPGANLHIS